MFPAYSVEKNFILLYLSLPVLGGGSGRVLDAYKLSNFIRYSG